MRREILFSFLFVTLCGFVYVFDHFFVREHNNFIKKEGEEGTTVTRRIPRKPPTQKMLSDLLDSYSPWIGELLFRSSELSLPSGNDLKNIYGQLAEAGQEEMYFFTKGYFDRPEAAFLSCQPLPPGLSFPQIKEAYETLIFLGLMLNRTVLLPSLDVGNQRLAASSLFNLEETAHNLRRQLGKVVHDNFDVYDDVEHEKGERRPPQEEVLKKVPRSLLHNSSGAVFRWPNSVAIGQLVSELAGYKGLLLHLPAFFADRTEKGLVRYREVVGQCFAVSKAVADLAAFVVTELKLDQRQEGASLLDTVTFKPPQTGALSSAAVEVRSTRHESWCSLLRSKGEVLFVSYAGRLTLSFGVGGKEADRYATRSCYLSLPHLLLSLPQAQGTRETFYLVSSAEAVQSLTLPTGVKIVSKFDIWSAYCREKDRLFGFLPLFDLFSIIDTAVDFKIASMAKHFIGTKWSMLSTQIAIARQRVNRLSLDYDLKFICKQTDCRPTYTLEKYLFEMEHSSQKDQWLPEVPTFSSFDSTELLEY